MFCTKCGKKLSDDAKICDSCKTPVEDKVSFDDVKDFFSGSEKPQPNTQGVNGVFTENYNPNNGYGQPNIQNVNGIPIKNYKPNLDYTPIGMWGYFLYNILFNLPIVGWILIILFSLGLGRNVNIRNFARSWFCMYILIIVGFILVMFMINA